MYKLKVVDASKIFRRDGQEVVALQATTMQIPAGRFVSIIGPSGCGKSTLFNMIAGLIKPTTGKILLDGQNIVGKSGYVGYMLQKDLLLPWRTILDNVILGLEIKGVSKREARKKAQPLLERYGLQGFENNYPPELSGGMRQRAALLRTLLYDQDVILLDEPFGALDAQTRLQMQGWLLRIWEDFQKTILFITHDIDEAIYLSDDIYVLSHRPGKLKAKIHVELERPRGEETLLSDNFISLKQKLLDLLREEPKDNGTT
ncbi:ABC transporter ATP-binding protein [Terribacillus saccharophilus]|uniref:ABC transporter n=1 Tax=Terribacillus saccharophilus TaxID=361277 RepID=A0A268AE54_9BACI|nr:ABC transporter ATP-binding protein [Terribacillus saccharophilus]PAD22408.1 ABC transporter [Terribacillus saccharophilus]PAF18747.1 ABC transporter [Terribacillus saccharophilus]PAF23308.1 ABC transporter [Terribacillus saccharophilus]PAF35330.1 ABC transporter [Terribacillus saccharophilus]PAF36992.1 ABC transporter [Terribacillus saccharophilus]